MTLGGALTSIKFEASEVNKTFDLHFIFSSSLSYILSARPTEYVLYKNVNGSVTRVWTVFPDVIPQ